MCDISPSQTFWSFVLGSNQCDCKMQKQGIQKMPYWVVGVRIIYWSINTCKRWRYFATNHQNVAVLRSYVIFCDICYFSCASLLLQFLWEAFRTHRWHYYLLLCELEVQYLEYVYLTVSWILNTCWALDDVSLWEKLSCSSNVWEFIASLLCDTHSSDAILDSVSPFSQYDALNRTVLRFLACDCQAVTHAIVIDFLSVCLSVRPSVRLPVCQTRVLWQNEST